MEQVREIIKKAKPNLKPNSITQYVAQLRKLQSLFETDNFNFLSNPKKVAEKIDHLHYTTQRNIYNSILVYLQGTESKKDDKFINDYITIRDALNDKYAEEQQSGKVSEKQKDKLVDISEIEDMISQLDSEVKPMKKRTSFTQPEISKIRAWILFNMLVRIPTRNDASHMIFISQSQYKKLSDKEKEQNNYLVKKAGGWKFIYNQYKTSKVYKENVLDVPADLQKLLKEYITMMKYQLGDDIFPFSPNAMSQLLLKYSKKYMGKAISTTMIRKSYMSSKYGKLKDELEEDSKKMMHSVKVGQSVYTKTKD